MYKLTLAIGLGRHLNQFAGFDIIDIPIDRYVGWNQRVRFDSTDVLSDADRLVFNR